MSDQLNQQMQIKLAEILPLMLRKANDMVIVGNEHFNKSDFIEAEKNYTVAIRWYESIISKVILISKHTLHIEIVRIKLSLGQTYSHIQAFEQAKKSFEQAEECLRDVIALNINEAAVCEAFYILGENLATGVFSLVAGENEGTIIEYLEHGIEKYPEEAFDALAQYVNKLEKFEEAVKYLMKINNSKPYKHMLLACLYKKSNKIELYIQHLKQAADFENPRAAFELAVIYDSGNYLPADSKSAIKYYNIAIHAGLPEALYNMAYKYLEEDDVVKNEGLAIEYLKKAVELNYPRAFEMLGSCYEKGLGGLSIDLTIAAQYFKTAVKLARDTLDDTLILTSSHNLALIYCNESNKTKDAGIRSAEINKAVEIWKEISMKGSFAACYNLGAIYGYGFECIDKNFDEGIRYFKQAIALGYGEAYIGLANLVIRETREFADISSRSERLEYWEGEILGRIDQSQPLLMKIYTTCEDMFKKNGTNFKSYGGTAGHSSFIGGYSSFTAEHSSFGMSRPKLTQALTVRNSGQGDESSMDISVLNSNVVSPAITTRQGEEPYSISDISPIGSPRAPIIFTPEELSIEELLSPYRFIGVEEPNDSVVGYVQNNSESNFDVKKLRAYGLKNIAELAGSSISSNTDLDAAKLWPNRELIIPQIAALADMVCCLQNTPILEMDYDDAIELIDSDTEYNLAIKVGNCYVGMIYYKFIAGFIEDNCEQWENVKEAIDRLRYIMKHCEPTAHVFAGVGAWLMIRVNESLKQLLTLADKFKKEGVNVSQAFYAGNDCVVEYHNKYINKYISEILNQGFEFNIADRLLLVGNGNLHCDKEHILAKSLGITTNVLAAAKPKC